MTNFNQKLLEFHEEYNLIFDEQDKLPSKKNNKDYSDLESVIISMAQNLIKKLKEFKRDSQGKDNSEIDNMIDGCYTFIKNPYERFGMRKTIKK